MRDVIIVSLVIPWAILALRRPWLGVLLWLWISLMNPHRFAYGFSYDAPLAMIAALATLLGLVFTQQRDSPFKSASVVFFVAFSGWVTLSWQLGLDPANQFAQWEKVMKVNLMVLVCLCVFRTKEQIFLLAWVLTMSVALLSMKGGLFTIAHGGSYRVWGPPGSWIEGNNEFAVATIMAVPLLRFLQLQVTHRWLSLSLGAGMLLSVASALGSHSRGALLAIIAMATVFWWRGKNRLRNGLLFVVLGLAGVSAMPDNWTQRMDTIETYEEDASALGRFSAWWVSWRLALNYPFGVGFNISRPDLFLAHSPYGMEYGTPVAHSIWFQILGHHGLIGFALFVAIWASAWFIAGSLRRVAREQPAQRWVGDLGAMCQVSIVGYAAGGSFLQLAYYDFPYYVMALIAITRVWVAKESWRIEPAPAPSRWRNLIGLGSPKQDAKATAAAGEPKEVKLPARAPGRHRPTMRP